MINYISQDYSVQYGIGKSKYCLSYYTGKKHNDGSKFYDIALFKSKKALNNFIKYGV
jgi:hypothetical protein